METTETIWFKQIMTGTLHRRRRCGITRRTRYLHIAIRLSPAELDELVADGLYRVCGKCG